MKKIKRIVETEKHMYLMEFTPGWLSKGLDTPNDVQILAVDGEPLDEEEEIAAIQSIEPAEHEEIIEILAKYESEKDE